MSSLQLEEFLCRQTILECNGKELDLEVKRYDHYDPLRCSVPNKFTHSLNQYTTISFQNSRIHKGTFTEYPYNVMITFMHIFQIINILFCIIRFLILQTIPEPENKKEIEGIQGEIAFLHLLVPEVYGVLSLFAVRTEHKVGV